MADTGWLNPSATGKTYNEWTNPTYAYSSDNQYASSSSNNSNNEQDYYNFNISIPSDAAIDGIEVSIEGTPYLLKKPNFRVKLSWNNGSSWTSTKDTGIYDSEMYKSVGGSSDTWGRSWSPSEFSNSNFLLYISNIGDSSLAAYPCCDHIRIKIYYTISSSSVSISQSVTKSVTKSVTQSVTKSVTQSVTKSVTKSATKSTTKSTSKSKSVSISISISKIISAGNCLILEWCQSGKVESVGFDRLEVDMMEVITNHKISLQRLQSRAPLIYEFGYPWKNIIIKLNSWYDPNTHVKVELIRACSDIMILKLFAKNGSLMEHIAVRVKPETEQYYFAGNLDAEIPLTLEFYEASSGEIAVEFVTIM